MLKKCLHQVGHFDPCFLQIKLRLHLVRELELNQYKIFNFNFKQNLKNNKEIPPTCIIIC